MEYRNFYQIYDLVSKSVMGPPMIERRDGPAIRSFTDLLADNNTLLSKHPADYELRLVGRQDIETGQIVPMEQPMPVATGSQWLESEAQRASKGDGR